MFSNIALCMRSILRKNLTKEFKERTNLDAMNEHGLSTLLSAVILIPIACIMESPQNIISSFLKISTPSIFIMNLFFCGICFYLYNELQNIVLSTLGPVPTAVGNTLKRVIIFIALYLFTPNEIFPWEKVLGCAIAIAGCFAFALFDSFKW